jgi:hypothetical protein
VSYYEPLLHRNQVEGDLTARAAPLRSRTAARRGKGVSVDGNTS